MMLLILLHLCPSLAPPLDLMNKRYRNPILALKHLWAVCSLNSHEVMTSCRVVKRPAIARLNSCIWSPWYCSLPWWGWRKSQGYFSVTAERRSMQDHINWNPDQLLTLDHFSKVHICSINWHTSIQNHSASAQPLCFKQPFKGERRSKTKHTMPDHSNVLMVCIVLLTSWTPSPRRYHSSLKGL